MIGAGEAQHTCDRIAAFVRLNAEPDGSGVPAIPSERPLRLRPLPAADTLRSDIEVPVIFIDGDACPVKQEVYRVAHRYGVHVRLVAESWMRVPENGDIELIVVKGDFDAADDWIVEHVTERDIVITGDIPLADRCLKLGARVLGLRGREFTEESIGEAMAGRELASELRDLGIQTGGPRPFDKRDRSQFLQKLDAMLHTP